MKTLLLKTFVFLAIICIPQVIVCSVVKRIEAKVRDPRARILSKSDPSRYRYAMLGDSVFCSFYVDDESQTLWKQIEAGSGEPVLPGALNAARPNDIIRAAIYLGERLKPGTVVFVDAIPGRFWGENSQSNNAKLATIMGDYDYSTLNMPLSDLYLKLIVNVYAYKASIEDLKIIYRFVQNRHSLDTYKTRYFRDKVFHNRIWNRDGAYASEKFNAFIKSAVYANLGSYDFTKLDRIAEVLEKSQLKPVFVLTPLNTTLLDTYSKAESAKVLSKFESYHEALRLHLASKSYKYLDYTDLVPSEGFADMFHTNILGDSLVSRKMTEFIRRETTSCKVR